jgi:hypothetical protein
MAFSLIAHRLTFFYGLVMFRNAEYIPHRIIASFGTVTRGAMELFYRSTKYVLYMLGGYCFSLIHLIDAVLEQSPYYVTIGHVAASIG